MTPELERAAARFLPETAERAALIIDDDDAQRVIVAWTSAGIRWRPPSGGAPGATDTALDWIWSGSGYDAYQIASIAGIDARKTILIIERLRRAMIIWPDGTANKFALGVIQERVRRALNLPKKRGKA